MPDEVQFQKTSGVTFVHDLRRFTEQFVAAKLYSDSSETAKDNAVITAIRNRKLAATDRKRQVVDWLNYMRVLMSFPQDARTLVAEQIITYADGTRQDLLHQDKVGIVIEFDTLRERVCRFAPRTKNGEERDVTSLTSKALWCCYPDAVPIFDNNAAGALRVIGRLCHFAPVPKQSKYACFVDLWLKVYAELEPVISDADLSGCPYRVRLLDRLLWYLGQSSFYDKG